QNQGETLVQTAMREVAEETGMDATRYLLADLKMHSEFEIYEEWRWRYAPGVMRNTEHVFELLVPKPARILLSAREHLNFAWMPWQDAAEKVFSPSNAAAIRALAEARLSEIAGRVKGPSN